MCAMYSVGALARRIGHHAKPVRFGRVPLGILDLGVFAGTFLFRWLNVEFTNDHFMHLSRARQILLGDVPIRDFFDPGLFLQYYLSAAAQLVFGYSLFGEAILTISLVAFGTMLVFHLSAQLSGSRWLAAGAALLTVVANPRLYSYPKAFLYVSAIGLVWLYARRGSRLHISLMAVLTAVAFLLRHDHGVYIAFMVVCFLCLREWGGARLWRCLGLYAGVTAGLLLPFGVFVETTTGLVKYVGGSGQQQQTIVSSLSSIPTTSTAFRIDLSAPLWLVEPAAAPRVTVHWAERADAAVRRDREVRYGLAAGARQEGRTWSYILTDHETANVRALVLDPMVEDTAGIDRGRFRVVPERWESWLTRKLFVLRLSLVPGVFTAQNAVAWFYYLTLLTPIVALCWVGGGWWSGRVARPEAAVVVAAAILSAIISQTLVRGEPGVRLPDIAAPTFVLAAWLAGRGGRGRPPFRARLERAGIVSLYVLTFWSVWTSGGNGSLTARMSSVLGGPVGVWEQISGVSRQLRDRPIDQWSPPGTAGLPALARYLFDCTAPSDRVLATWAPDVFYYAERGFAGGQAFLLDGGHDSIADQRLTLERMQRQSVPVILSRPGELSRLAFPLVNDHVRTRYRLVAESTFGGDETYQVFVDKQLEPDGEHPHLELPCYQEITVDTSVLDVGPVIHIRWVETLDDARRVRLERALGLYRAEHTEGTTWRYQVPDASSQRLLGIVSHNMVADTNGFNRGNLELDAPAGDVSKLVTQPLAYTSGWHPPESDATTPESTWRWTQQLAVLSFTNPNADAVLYLDYAARPDALAEGPQTVTVSIGDQVLQSFVADSTGKRLHGTHLPAATLGTGDRVEIQIAVDRTFVPATLPAGGRDRRKLGIQVYNAFVVLR